MTQNTAVIPFTFETKEVRTTTDNHGNPWFVAKDVCDILGLENITNALVKIPEKHLGLIRLMSGGQFREMKTVDEPGLYRLILRSDKPQSEPFMEWVTPEVLPQIRKTGSYTASPSHKKFCSRCGNKKPFSEFNKNYGKPDGYNYSCKECSNEAARLRYETRRRAASADPPIPADIDADALIETVTNRVIDKIWSVVKNTGPQPCDG